MDEELTTLLARADGRFVLALRHAAVLRVLTLIRWPQILILALSDRRPIHLAAG